MTSDPTPVLPMPSGPAIEARRLTKRFGDLTAVDDLSFTAPAGAVTGLVGGNGSGKTTTMRMLLGLTLPSSGDALLAGKPIIHHDDVRRVVGASVDRVGAHPGFSGGRHLELLAAASSVPGDRVGEMLDLVGLADVAHRRVATYSTGMRQRLALAAALLGDPPILILDEPSNGLDPAGIRWMRSILRWRAESGGAILLATHQLAELAKIVDHLVVLDRGRLVTSGPTGDVLSAANAESIEDVLLQGTPS